MMNCLQGPSTPTKNRTITFAVNHDVANGSSMGKLVLDPVDEMLAQVFTLTIPYGIPYIYTDRGTEGGLRSDRWKNAHRASILKSLLRFRATRANDSITFMQTDPCKIIFRRGENAFVGINKCDESWQGNISVPVKGACKDILSGVDAPRKSENVIFKIPGRGATVPDCSGENY